MKRILVITALLATAGFAQTHTNFSGTWKLNVGKSDFGMMPPPESRTDTIEQTDGAIKDTVSTVNQQGPQNYTANIKTDGTETLNHLGNRDVKMSATWDGPALVVTQKLDFQGNEVVVKSNWTLSEDGNTMTQASHVTSPMGEMDMKAIYEKQSGNAPTAPAAPTTQAAPAPPAAPSGPRPNYSGVWKLNPAKSDFGVLPGPDSQTSTIEHSDPALKVAVVQESAAQGKQEFQLNLTTDGKEATNHAGGAEVKSTAGWEGNNLIVNSKLTIQDNEVTLKSVYSLSPDGKTMTVNTHLASAMGETDQKMVFEKQ